LSRPVLGVSLGIVFLGVAVLTGWHVRVAPVVQIFPGLVAMQYNAALCFLALGVAGIGIPIGQRALTFLGGCFAASMGSVVIFQYWSGTSLGIDTYFVDPWLRPLSAHPGRMALTTAISFFLYGIALVVLALRPRAYAVLGLVSSIPLALGLTSLIGYAFQITFVLPYDLGTQMALHTSAAILVYGAAMLAYAWERSERGADGLPRWGTWIGIAFVPVTWVAASALLPRNSWGASTLEVLLTFAIVALIALGVSRLSTAKVAYKGLFMISVPLLVLLLFLGFVVRVKTQSDSALSMSQHAHDVSSHSQHLIALVTGVESGVRAYLITRDEHFVEAFDESVSRFAESSASLHSLVADDAVQMSRVRSIETLAASRLAHLSDVVRIVRGADESLIEETTKDMSGVQTMEHLVAEMALFSQAQERLVDERQLSLDTSWRKLSWLLASGVASAILLAGLLVLLFSVGISRRIQQLRDNAIHFAAGEGLAPQLSGHDEIADLDRVFHEMARSLDGVRERETVQRTLASQRVDAQHADALRKNGALQRAIFSSTNFSSIATDVQGVIQVLNVGAERMLGYSASELTEKRSPVDFFDPLELIARATALSEELGQPVEPGFEALVAKSARGTEEIYQLTCLRKDGSRFPLVLSVTALRDAEDWIIGYLLIGIDNSARHQIEEQRLELDEQLRDQHFYTRSLIESNIDAMMTTDADGVITDVNKQTESMTGRSRDELIGAPFKDCFTDPARAEAGVARVLNEGKVTNYELTARARDGRETLVSYNATTFLDREHRVKGVFAAGRDMTELKRYERTLQQKNIELQGASRMKSEFLANMSHELRTPLNAIIGFSEVLGSGMMGNMTDKQREFLSDIFDSGKQLLSLINDILDLSKVEAGMMLLDLEVVDMTSLLASGLSAVSEKAASRSIHVDLGAPEDLGSTEVDARKVKQILYNLLSNAVKFSKVGGQVSLRARRVAREDVSRLSGMRAGRSLPLPENEHLTFFEISVTDAGIGIPHDGLERLFKPFTQIDGGLSRRFEGTGLGLAMVKLLSELHGGTVAVESTEGEGSCFTVWLPDRAPKPETLDAQTLVPLGSLNFEPGSRNALVVEDDSRSADIIRVQLEAEGFTVLNAASAEEALAIATSPGSALSLITLDIMLPDMDGWQFLEIVKQRPELRRIPVVIISILGDRNKGFSLGASAVMQKPISRQELYESLVDLGLFPLSQGQTLKILIVDDDPKAVELIALRMTALAATVLRAHGGREAIDMARLELPDLIVLDLMMPDVSGFDVVAALNERADTARIPILVVTAKEITAQDRIKLHGSVTAIVEKAEFDRERFSAEVRRAMSGRREGV
jgi:PAS domain S-box-containing protein